MKISVRQITFTAIITALNVLFSMFSVPMPFGGHLYLTDIAVCLAGITLNPILAVFAGGVGSFLGDLFFYPAAMFVTLITRSVQAAVISLFSNYLGKNKQELFSIIGCTIGVIIMTLGYTLGSAFVYSTPEYAIYKIPLELLQAAIGAAVAIPICYQMKIKALMNGYIKKDAK